MATREETVFWVLIDFLFVCLFVTKEVLYSIIQYHGGLRSRELGQAPRQALSYHLPQQMVRLYWLQDIMPNWYTINHSTTLHTDNEIKWPNAAHRWHLELTLCKGCENVANDGHFQYCKWLSLTKLQPFYSFFRLSTFQILYVCITKKQKINN